MISKRKFITIIVLVALLFTGCHQTPSTTIVSNDKIEVQLQETFDTGEILPATVVTLSEEPIDEEWECGDITVTVKGTKIVPNSLKGLYVYEAEINDHTEYEERMMFLFGEHEKIVEKTVGDSPNIYVYEAICQDCDYSALILNTFHSGFASANYIMYYGGMKPVTEDKQKVNMTEKEAVYQAHDILKEIGLDSFEYDRLFYYEENLQITPEGTLSSPTGDILHLFFHQQLQGVAVKSSLIEGRIEAKAKVEFNSSGVFKVLFSEYEFEPYGNIEECLSYEEAVDKFKNFVSNEESLDGVVFDKVIFEYTVKKDYINGKFIEIAVPCWHFYSVRDYMGMPDGGQRWSDVVVDCSDGSVSLEQQFI